MHTSTRRTKVVAAAFVATVSVVGSVAFAGISGGAIAAQRADLLLAGPVDAISVKEQTVSVLGQRVTGLNVRSVSVGDALAVFGELRSTGVVAARRVQKLNTYTAGASLVLVTGKVKSFDRLHGTLQIGNLVIDVNSLLGDVSPEEFGDAWIQLVGTQPTPGGLMLTQGISGGALQGISGGALQGISGGALQGISGGALQGISGGALQGISGGALQGISGGALQGVSGGALQGISGGALQGISGGALQGISGGARR